jgi:fatty acid desaturase
MPRSAKLVTPKADTTRRSSTQTSTSATALLSNWVSISSAREGWLMPLGWLCVGMTAAAFQASASSTK